MPLTEPGRNDGVRLAQIRFTAFQNDAMFGQVLSDDDFGSFPYMDAFSGLHDDGSAFTQEYLALEAVGHVVVVQVKAANLGGVHVLDTLPDLVQRDDPGGIRGVEYRGSHRSVFGQVQIDVQTVGSHFQGGSRCILHQGSADQRHVFRNGKRACSGQGAQIVDKGSVTENLGVSGQGNIRAVGHVEPVDQPGGFFRGDGPICLVVRTACIERNGGVVGGGIRLGWC